jgi:hypothetical protein
MKPLQMDCQWMQQQPKARKAISFAVSNSVEWITPVLYMRLMAKSLT